MAKTPEEQEKLLGKLENFLNKFEEHEKEGNGGVTKIPVKKVEPETDPVDGEKSGFFSWLFGE